jgi:hypothetical protein
MPIKIGFSILTHNEPQQLLRLVKTLNAMFGGPPIVCHHDFSQCALEEALFPTNVRFVHPHIVTRWGHITLPLAALKAFSLLRKYDQPDWVFLLSGSDYPIRPADEIVSDLANANFDVYLDNREIRYLDLGQRLGFGQSPDGDLALTIIGAAQDDGFERPSWIPLAYYRYCTCRRPTKTLLFSGRLEPTSKVSVVDPRLLSNPTPSKLTARRGQQIVIPSIKRSALRPAKERDEKDLRLIYSQTGMAHRARILNLKR